MRFTHAKLWLVVIAILVVTCAISVAFGWGQSSRATDGLTAKALKPPNARMIIGRSVQGRPIVALRYGDPHATRVGVLIGSMHGSELGGLPVVKNFRTRGALPGTAMWVVPNINPDGAAIGRRQNAHGVDLNRNGPDLWKGHARSPEYYPGPRPMSEPETRVYMSFLQAVKPDMVLIYHQAGNGVDSYQQKTPSLTKGLARSMRLPIKSFNCDGECTGTLTGWFNKTQPGTAITIELTRPVSKSQVIRWGRAARQAIMFVPDK